LERERERLLEILKSRTASHGEIQRAREMLEESSQSDSQPERSTPRLRLRKFWT
jgi:hypothetical protein